MLNKVVFSINPTNSYDFVTGQVVVQGSAAPGMVVIQGTVPGPAGNPGQQPYAPPPAYEGCPPQQAPMDSKAPAYNPDYMDQKVARQ